MAVYDKRAEHSKRQVLHEEQFAERVSDLLIYNPSGLSGFELWILQKYPKIKDRVDTLVRYKMEDIASCCES